MDRNSTRLLVAPALAGITLILTGALVTGSAQTPPPDSQAAETQQTQILTADQLTDLVAPDRALSRRAPLTGVGRLYLSP